MNSRKANLFIVGAAKCGTTSLYEYLSYHPDIFMSPVKEPHFFAINVANKNKELYLPPSRGEKYHTKIIRDINVYNSLFEGGNDCAILGEASPSYLWDKTAAEKIYQYNKEAKIIILLREPIKRLVSQYQMAQSLGITHKGSFLDMIRYEYSKEEKIWGIDHIYIDLGFYYQQISRYSNLFPETQIMIIKFEDLIKRKELCLKRIFQFLEVSDSYVNASQLNEIHNAASHPRYSFINDLKKIKLVKALGNSLPSAKRIFKRKLYKQGYNSKFQLSDEAQSFLKHVYEEDLLKLEKFYNIVF
jgi:hypothetical protein